MPPVLRRPLAGIAALGAAALIAGCGGGSGSLSADEFRGAGRRHLRRRRRAPRDPHRAHGGRRDPPFLRAGLPIQAEELGRIEELGSADELQAASTSGGAEPAAPELIQQAADRIEAGEDPQAVIAEVTPEIERLAGGAGEGARAGPHGLRPRGRRGVSTAGGATATAPTDATTGTTGARGETAQYLEDVGAAVASLRASPASSRARRASRTCRPGSPSRGRARLLRRRGRRARGLQLRQRHARGAARRARRVRPRVSDQLRRFLTAAESGDAEAIQAVLPGVTQALTEFQDAATP